MCKDNELKNFINKNFINKNFIKSKSSKLLIMKNIHQNILNDLKNLLNFNYNKTELNNLKNNNQLMKYVLFLIIQIGIVLLTIFISLNLSQKIITKQRNQKKTFNFNSFVIDKTNLCSKTCK